MFSDSQSFFTDVPYPNEIDGRKDPELPSSAFEVEDMKRRENYVFWLREDTGVVELINTTRTFQPLSQYGQKRRKETFGPKQFPFGCQSADEYFRHMYNKALSFEDHPNIMFLAWIDPSTGEELETE